MQGSQSLERRSLFEEDWWVFGGYFAMSVRAAVKGKSARRDKISCQTNLIYNRNPNRNRRRVFRSFGPPAPAITFPLCVPSTSYMQIIVRGRWRQKPAYVKPLRVAALRRKARKNEHLESHIGPGVSVRQEGGPQSSIRGLVDFIRINCKDGGNVRTAR